MCVCVCVCVCYHASGYILGLYVQSEAAYSFLQAFKDMYCVDLLKIFHSGDMALCACHDDRRLGSFSTKNTPMVLDMIKNGIVYESLARSDDYLN